MKLVALILAIASPAIAGDAATDTVQVPVVWSGVRCIRNLVDGADCVICSDSRSFSPAVACSFPPAVEAKKAKKQ